MTTSRMRDKRRGTKYAGILRNRSSEERPVVEHSEPRRSPVNWRVFSGVIVATLVLVLLLFFSADAFYVRSVAVGGVKYLTKEEIFAYADIANVHIFWINPEQVRLNLLRSPAIADARITLAWPPNMVNIVIEEREPALVWEQNGTAVWVDIQGRIMAQREDRPDLMRISAQGDTDQGPLAESGKVDEAVVFGALELQEVMPEAHLLVYDAVRGLGYRNEYGWDVWFGTGTGMAEKYQIYSAIRDNIIAKGIQAGEVNIVNPDAPYYNVMWGREANTGQ